MRTLLTVFIALLMVIGSPAGVVMAQGAGTPEAADDDAAETVSGGDTSFARGLDAEAVYFSERGDPVATVMVVDIERGWQEFAEYYEPDPGVEYVAVTFEISNVSRSNIVIEPYDFSLIDGFGRNNSSAFVEASEDSGVELFADEVAVASGETTELVVVFEVFEESQLGYFMWQPDSGIIIMVDLTEI